MVVDAATLSIHMQGDAFLQWHYRNAATSAPKPYHSKLTSFGRPGNDPKTGQMSSPRNKPGVVIEPYAAFVGLPVPDLVANLEWYLREEELWRGFGTPPGTDPALALPPGKPDVAYEPDGTGPLLNSAGAPKPVTVFDILHLEIQHLAVFERVFFAADRPDLAKRARWQQDKLCDLVFETYLGKPWTSLNQRAIGWMLQFCAIRRVASTGKDSRARKMAAQVILFCKSKMGIQNGVPFITLNEIEAKDPNGDHKGKRICDWMDARIVIGLDDWASIEGYDNPKFADGKEVFLRGLWGIDWSMTACKQEGYPTGALMADHDPEPAPAGSWHKIKIAYDPMDAWAWPAVLAGMRREPQAHAAFVDRLKAAYLARDSMSWTDKNFKGEWASVAILMANKYGWQDA